MLKVGAKYASLIVHLFIGVREQGRTETKSVGGQRAFLRVEAGNEIFVEIFMSQIFHKFFQINHIPYKGFSL